MTPPTKKESTCPCNGPYTCSVHQGQFAFCTNGDCWCRGTPPDAMEGDWAEFDAIWERECGLAAHGGIDFTAPFKSFIRSRFLSKAVLHEKLVTLQQYTLHESRCARAQFIDSGRNGEPPQCDCGLGHSLSDLGLNEQDV